MTIGFDEPFLSHHGVKGQKWGLRRYQNEDGSLTDEGKQRYGNSVFISGTTKTSEDGLYKRDKLPDKISKEIDKYITEGRKILVGDAPGIDSQVQDYLSGKNYKNVEVFVSGDEVRKMAGEKLDWTVNNIDGENFEKYSKEWRAVKDKAMNSVASEGLAVVIKNGSGATRNNISRFIEAGKKVSVYQLDDENFVDPKSNRDEYEKMNHNDLIPLEDFLAHHGITGQKWGQRRFQNEDGSLTPEGRIRYGLKPEYANLSDKEMNEAMSRKRYQNQYVDLMTAKSRKKKSDMDSLISEIGKFTNTGIDVVDKIGLQGFKDYNKQMQTDAENRNKAANRAKSVAGISAEERARIENEIAANNAEIARSKQALSDTKNAVEGFKKGVQATNETIAFKNKMIKDNAEIRRDREIAMRNIEEMDPDQLKKTVDRMLLEKQYDELLNPPKPSKVEKGKEILQTIGAVAGVALTVAQLIRLFKGKGDDTAKEGDEDGEYLAHYGVEGMKKGVRRWTYEDGSLTPEGYRHYGIDPNRATARVAKTPEQKRKELKEQARQREFTKKLEARQALRDAKTQSQIQSVYDRQRLQTQYAEGKLGNKLAAENRANVRRNIIKGVVAVAATVSAMYVGRHILRESSLNNAHLREIDKINEESRMRINEAVAKADTIRLTDKDLVRLQNEDNADARRHAEEMGRQVNEATRNAHQQITGSQGAYLTSTKNVAENTTNKMEKLYRSSTSSRGLTAETGDAVRGRGRGARAVSYGGNALAINGTPEGGTPGDHAIGQRARAYERNSKYYKVSDESRKRGIDAMEKISRRYNIGATKVSKFALKGHNSIAARGLETLRLLALR